MVFEREVDDVNDDGILLRREKVDEMWWVIFGRISWGKGRSVPLSYVTSLIILTPYLFHRLTTKNDQEWETDSAH